MPEQEPPADVRQQLLEELAALRRQLAEADARIRALEERLAHEAEPPPPASSD